MRHTLPQAPQALTQQSPLSSSRHLKVSQPLPLSSTCAATCGPRPRVIRGKPLGRWPQGYITRQSAFKRLLTWIRKGFNFALIQ